MKPWHLCSEEDREAVLTWLAEAIPPADMDGDYGDAWEAAAAVLRDAAPAYPDDCPAFGFRLDQEYVCQIVDIDDDLRDDGERWCLVVECSGYWDLQSCMVSALRPLTPAAAEFLAAMGGE